MLGRDQTKNSRPTLTGPWGQHDLRLTMQRGASVDIVVVAADTGVPVEEFQVRVFPDPKVATRYDSRAFEVRTRGKHDSGRAVVSGIARGAWRLVVEPRGDVYAMSEFVPINVTDGAKVATIRLARNVERPLHVRTTRGDAVAGTKVQLAIPLGDAIDAEASVWPISSLGRSTDENQAFVVHEASTDAAGHAVLRAGRSLRPSLLVLGPGHVPLIVPQVSVDSAEPLVVTVASGAHVVGTVAPPAVLKEFDRLGGEFTRRARELGRRKSPYVMLRRADAGPGARQYPGDEAPAVVGDDGGFEIIDAPPGRWAVCVAWHVAAAGMVGATLSSRQFATVELKEGETATCHLELSSVLPLDVEGVAWRNGERLVNMQFGLQRRPDPAQRTSSQAIQTTTDAEGRFRARLPAGVYQATRWVDAVGVFTAQPPIVVSDAQHPSADLHFDTGTVRTRVLDADGNPVAKLSLVLRDMSDDHRRSLPPTDADGWTTAEIEAERFVAQTLPERFLDPEAQRELLRVDPAQAKALWLEAGIVAARPGATVEIELRLPPTFRR